MPETIFLLHASLVALGGFSLVRYIDSWGFFRIRHSYETPFYPLFQVFCPVLRSVTCMPLSSQFVLHFSALFLPLTRLNLQSCDGNHCDSPL